MKDIIEFIKTQVKQSGTKGVVLGLSGGIDSAVVAVLAQKALGKNKVHCFYLSYVQDDNDVDHIKKLCNKFKLKYNKVTIKQIVDLFYHYPKNELIKGNIKSRVRMTYLYTFANSKNCLVIGTTNKSELLTGYFTKYGDGGVDFEPIAHLYKTEVIKLAKKLGIPDEIINKPPTAGLWNGQTDEHELGMTYKELDEYLMLIEFDSIVPRAIHEEMPKMSDKYYKVKEMVEKSKHKRNPPEMK